MSGSDVEKGAGTLPPQTPRATHSQTHDGFLPTYQEHLNSEMRNFRKTRPLINLQPFDRIQEPASKVKAFIRRRVWWSAISILLFVTVSALVGSAVYVYRSTHLKDDVIKVSSPVSSFETITIGTLTPFKHAHQTSMPIPARSATTTTIYNTTVVGKTVFITVTISAPRTFTSTTILFVTVHPSSASPTSQDTASSTEEEEASTITFSTETTSGPSISTIASSTEASSSSLETTTTTSSSSPTPPPPPPSTIATTLVSTTTATATPTTSSTKAPPTRTGMLGFCGVIGEACA